MKLLTALMMATMIAGTACADTSDDAGWKKRYGLDPACSNPVFTRPGHMNTNSRVHGAGICMNDGLAYTNRGASFSNDWHYEPKLPLCRQEADVMPRVLAMPATRPFAPGENGEPLKFCCVPHHGCGATVVYRTFRIWRTSRYQTVEQFIAVYDSNGTLTDCMTMGMQVGDDSDNDLRAVLLAEPHAAYAVQKNRGSNDVTFDDDGNGFTIKHSWHLTDGAAEKVSMSRHYSITAEGRLVPEAPRATDGGVLLADVANADAAALYELMRAPLSDTGTLARLESITPAALANSGLHDLLVHVAMMHFFRNPKAYVEHAYARRNVSAPGLTRLLKEAARLDSGGMQYGDCLPPAIDRCGAPADAIRYAMRAVR